MELSDSVKINYLKSPSYRTIHVDGALGGPTPDLNVYIALWSQRGAIPDVTVHSVTPEGQVNPQPKEVVARSTGMVREVECGVMMNLEAARNFHRWLGEKIAEIDTLVTKASRQDANIQ